MYLVQKGVGTQPTVTLILL